jgi:hypothetical protein
MSTSRSRSTVSKRRPGNQLTSGKSQQSCLKKYFAELHDFEDVLQAVNPKQVLDSGTIQPVIKLNSIQKKSNKVIQQFMESQ